MYCSISPPPLNFASELSKKIVTRFATLYFAYAYIAWKSLSLCNSRDALIKSAKIRGSEVCAGKE